MERTQCGPLEFFFRVHSYFLFVSPDLAKMPRHKLYTDNYCTSRVILHEAQPSVISLYECNKYQYSTKQVSFLFYIFPGRDFK